MIIRERGVNPDKKIILLFKKLSGVFNVVGEGVDPRFQGFVENVVGACGPDTEFELEKRYEEGATAEFNGNPNLVIKRLEELQSSNPDIPFTWRNATVLPERSKSQMLEVIFG